VGVIRARVAVDAAVLAAAIGIDRAAEEDVGGFVPGDHAAGRLVGDPGGGRRRRNAVVPGLVECCARLRIGLPVLPGEAPGRLRDRPPLRCRGPLSRPLSMWCTVHLYSIAPMPQRGASGSGLAAI